MKVKCIDMSEVTGLTLNKVYSVEESDEFDFQIKNDLGEPLYYLRSRFEIDHAQEIQEYLQQNLRIELNRYGQTIRVKLVLEGRLLADSEVSLPPTTSY